MLAPSCSARSFEALASKPAWPAPSNPFPVPPERQPDQSPGRPGPPPENYLLWRYTLQTWRNTRPHHPLPWHPEPSPPSAIASAVPPS